MSLKLAQDFLTQDYYNVVINWGYIMGLLIYCYLFTTIHMLILKLFYFFFLNVCSHTKYSPYSPLYLVPQDFCLVYFQRDTTRQDILRRYFLSFLLFFRGRFSSMQICLNLSKSRLLRVQSRPLKNINLQLICFYIGTEIQRW